MHRNLITRMGTASGVVAALVAAVFLMLVGAVRDVDRAGDRLVAAELRGSAPEAAAARGEKEDAVRTATVVGVGGLVGSTLLILALTSYLTRSIVVPLRRVTSAATTMAAGDLSARVAEEGDAEPRELARAFNELARGLETTLGELASEKRTVEVFHRAGQRMAAAPELETLAEVIVGELGDAAGAEAGALWAQGGDGTAALKLRATRLVIAEQMPRELEAGVGVAGRALEIGGTVHEREQVAVPLSLGGAVLGVVALGRVDGSSFGGDDLARLERLAGQASVALANVVSFRRAVRQAEVNRAVLDAVPDPIGLLGVGGGVVAENAPMAALRRRGLTPDGPAEAGEIRDELELEDRTYLRYAAPVTDETGTLIGRIVVLRDVTGERQSERLKDEFFAVVSHELRTPLTSIIGYLELLRDEDEHLPEDARRFLEVVDRNAKRLLRLVGDMLFVAQVEAGRLSLDRRPLRLDEVVADAVEAARPAAERGGVELLCDAEPAEAEADRDRMGQLVDNLISNAIKFTPAGGRVTVRLRPGELSVADTGVGIPGEEQDRLFERFFRSTTATSKGVQGVGLGLTVVRTIAEAHGGTVTVTSAENAGTTVSVRLPA